MSAAPPAIAHDLFSLRYVWRQTGQGRMLVYYCATSLDGMRFLVLDHGNVGGWTYDAPDNDGPSLLHFAKLDLNRTTFYPTTEDAIDAYHAANPKVWKA